MKKSGLGNMNYVMNNSEVNANQDIENTKNNVNVAKPMKPMTAMKKPVTGTVPKVVQPAKLTKPAVPMKIQPNSNSKNNKKK